MAIQIDKNIPMPDSRMRKYPWSSMAVGDSFFAPGRSATTMGGNASSVRRLYPERKFACRGVDGGTRVWRIK